MEDNGRRLFWENGSLIRKALGDAEPEKERGIYLLDEEEMGVLGEWCVWMGRVGKGTLK